MARKPRIEIEGRLYHVMSRGNNRRKTFRCRDDFIRFTTILSQQKLKLPFYLYAYCLMPNHVHLLIEMQEALISRIMQRLLTTYSQYHNRKYRKTGHLFQGRYKSILCQTDCYLAELVRYIHLNPVRAGIVKRPEDYEYSGHRAYLGLDKTGLVDAEAVLRHFGANKKLAVETYIRFVEARLAEKSQDQYYRASEGRLLGDEEFLSEIKHRVGEHKQVRKEPGHTSIEDLLSAAERSSGLSRHEFCSKSKNRKTVAVKEAIIAIGRENGIANRVLAEALGLDPSAITKRAGAAQSRAAEPFAMIELRKQLTRKPGR